MLNEELWIIPSGKWEIKSIFFLTMQKFYKRNSCPKDTCSKTDFLLIKKVSFFFGQTH